MLNRVMIGAHPLNIAAVSNDDVNGATGVIGIIVHPICPLVRMHMPEEDEVYSILV